MGIRRRSPGKWQVFDENGDLAVGWQLYTYIPGTTDDKATYSDKDGATPNTNPVVFDARGEADIWFNGVYDLKLTKESGDDSLVWTLSDFGEGEETVNYGNFNLVKNGGFEADTDGDTLPDDWDVTAYPTAGSGAGAVILDSTTQIEGLYSLKFTSQGDGGGYAVSDYFEVREAATLFLNWMMKSTDAGVRNVVEVLWYTAAKAAISTSSLYDDSTTNPTSWTEKTGSVTVPSTARYAKIRIYGCHSSDATTGSTWYDDIRAEANAYVKKSGDTMSGDLVLENTIALSSKDTGGTARDLAQLSAATPGTSIFGNTSCNSWLKFLNFLTLSPGYLNNVGDTALAFSTGGAYYNNSGATWVGASSPAYIVQFNPTSLAMYYDAAPSGNYSPTLIASINSTGVFSGGFRGASVYNTGNFTLTTGSEAPITWGSENYDTDSFHDTGSNTSRLTIPANVSRIKLHARLSFDANATGIRYAYFKKNGTTNNYVGIAYETRNNVGGTFRTEVTLSSPVLGVSEGNYFEVVGYQNSGGNLDVVGAATGYRSYFSIEVIT